MPTSTGERPAMGPIRRTPRPQRPSRAHRDDPTAQPGPCQLNEWPANLPTTENHAASDPAEKSGSDMTAQRQRRRRERLGLLPPEPPRLAGGLDGGLLDVGDCPFELVGVLGADGDEASGAEDAVAGGEVGLLLEDIAVLG